MTARAPHGLGSRGRRLWRAVVEDFTPAQHELELLTEACRTLDRVEALQAELADAPLTAEGSRGQLVAHPLAAELRSERQLLARLLSQLGIPEGEEGAEWDNLTASQRARKAAHARWGGRGSR